jgi:hypothetical protein
VVTRDKNALKTQNSVVRDSVEIENFVRNSYVTE